VLCESEDQAQFLIDGLDRVARALGGLSKDWRFDRMATVVSPRTGKVSASFAAVAKHYGVTVKPCPPRRGNRKGVVEKANHIAAQRFWRTVPDDVTVEEAQRRLDKWCATRGDVRMRRHRRRTRHGRHPRQGRAADGRCRAPFPAVLSVERVVSAQALVSYAGNRYSVPPELHGPGRERRSVRVGATHLDIATVPRPGRDASVPTIVARHRMAPAGAGATVRDDGHVTALSRPPSPRPPPRPRTGKQRRIPPGRAGRRPLRRDSPATPRPGARHDMRRRPGPMYAAAAAGRNTLPPRPTKPLTRGPATTRRRITNDTQPNPPPQRWPGTVQRPRRPACTSSYAPTSPP
jgi:hypothetical protein